MNKLAILFFTMMLVLLPSSMKADTTKDKNDDRYLAGAVPVVDGRVIFSKEFQIKGMSQKQIYDIMYKWMDERLKENGNAESRIVFTDEPKGIIAGVGEEWIIFHSGALSLDRAWINYQITATCNAGICTLEMEKIRYTYRETEKYKAEEWITDEYALNKSKTKLVRGLAKWRRKTVDFVDDMFMDAAVAFGVPDTRPKSAKKQKEEEKPALIVSSSQPIVIGEGGQVAAPIKETPAKEVSVSEVPVAEAPVTIPATKLTPATPVANATEKSSYSEVDLKNIPGDVFALMATGKLVISIGEDEFNMTNMTANSGGALGYLNGQAVAYCTLSADQPHELMDKANSYTVKLYAPNQTVPSAIIECKKLASQSAFKEGQPRTYVGEIIKMSIKN